MLDINPQVVQVAVFLIFFSITAVAFIFYKNRIIRFGFGVVFATALLLPGITGRTYWPFFSWHLFGLEQTQDLAYHEFRLQDADGREIKYDERAVVPTLATPLRRLAAKYPDLPTKDQNEIGYFLLSNAIDYQELILTTDTSLLAQLKFPPHQIGFAWTDENLSEIGPIETLVIYKVNARFSEDGREIQLVEKELVASFSAEQLTIIDD